MRLKVVIEYSSHLVRSCVCCSFTNYCFFWVMHVKLIRGLEFHFLRQVKSNFVPLVNRHIVWNLNIFVFNFKRAIFPVTIRESDLNVRVFDCDSVARFSNCSRCRWSFGYWLSYFCSCCWCFCHWCSFDCRWCFHYWCHCFRRCHRNVSAVISGVDIRHRWLCIHHWLSSFVR